jgi:hypothetical protein
MSKNKLRVIKDYDKLDKEIQEQVKLVYPEGFSQYLIEFRNAQGEMVSALPFETDEKVYMIRMSVKKAKQIIRDDFDYDDEGNLKEKIKEKYEDEYSDLDYLSDNDNYNLDSGDIDIQDDEANNDD